MRISHLWDPMGMYEAKRANTDSRHASVSDSQDCFASLPHWSWYIPTTSNMPLSSTYPFESFGHSNQVRRCPTSTNRNHFAKIACKWTSQNPSLWNSPDCSKRPGGLRKQCERERWKRREGERNWEVTRAVSLSWQRENSFILAWWCITSRMESVHAMKELHNALGFRQ